MIGGRVEIRRPRRPSPGRYRRASSPEFENPPTQRCTTSATTNHAAAQARDGPGGLPGSAMASSADAVASAARPSVAPWTLRSSSTSTIKANLLPTASDGPRHAPRVVDPDPGPDRQGIGPRTIRAFGEGRRVQDDEAFGPDAARPLRQAANGTVGCDDDPQPPSNRRQAGPSSTSPSLSGSSGSRRAISSRTRARRAATGPAAASTERPP